MKRRVLKKQMKRVLDSELPTMFKLSAMSELIIVSQRIGVFEFEKIKIKYERFSTSLHSGFITVSEHDCLTETNFSSVYKALVWICKHYENNVEYVLDSGCYRYRVSFL